MNGLWEWCEEALLGGRFSFENQKYGQFTQADLKFIGPVEAKVATRK